MFFLFGFFIWFFCHKVVRIFLLNQLPSCQKRQNYSLKNAWKCLWKKNDSVQEPEERVWVCDWYTRYINVELPTSWNGNTHHISLWRGLEDQKLWECSLCPPQPLAPPMIFSWCCLMSQISPVTNGENPVADGAVGLVQILAHASSRPLAIIYPFPSAFLHSLLSFCFLFLTTLIAPRPFFFKNLIWVVQHNMTDRRRVSFNLIQIALSY